MPGLVPTPLPHLGLLRAVPPPRQISYCVLTTVGGKDTGKGHTKNLWVRLLEDTLRGFLHFPLMVVTLFSVHYLGPPCTVLREGPPKPGRTRNEVCKALLEENKSYSQSFRAARLCTLINHAFHMPLSDLLIKALSLWVSSPWPPPLAELESSHFHHCTNNAR